ncbi:hypothetical protein KOR34_42800 [Posidoniimonas corsicana]|uniref:Uncharacterized protein n=1 Tax=Posidoniimonas corsicana TaxID=1938618 RepID=A0A5C5V438_9BACT|nr:hypothetical protein [Posidoniimonas corsicana]TWT32517.1 hypothetical protein KOR34_42800 [Posidoniimonas corsicana]
MPDANESFAHLQAYADEPGELLAQFAERCAAAGDWGRLFEARLMQARLRLGLPIDCTLLADRSAAVRDELEKAYHEACVEAGEGLIAAGRPVDAWPYLKAAGEQQRISAALRGVTPTEHDSEELIQLALHEGADPALGFRWLLEQSGTCNAVTTLDGLAGYLETDELRGCAEVLVGWLHRDLRDSIAAHIERQEGAPPSGDDFAEWYEGRPWLFEHESSHVDASHLGSTVRWSRLMEDRPLLEEAVRLADYGARLHESQRFPQPPPFEDAYTAHLLWLRAVLGDGVDQAVAYFRRQAKHADEYARPACVEEYVNLLARCGRGGEALGELTKLVPADFPLPPGAPTPLELARVSGAWDAYDRLVRQRGDVVGYAAGLIARRADP